MFCYVPSDSKPPLQGHLKQKQKKANSSLLFTSKNGLLFIITDKKIQYDQLTGISLMQLLTSDSLRITAISSHHVQ